MSHDNSIPAETKKVGFGQIVPVPAPSGGVDVTIQSSPGGEMVLGFVPRTALTSRPEGTNDLVFDLDSGKVTIVDFFAVGDKSLPDLKLPDGMVLASTDFSKGGRLDMTTAAYHDGGAPGGDVPGSGSGEYSDDPGSLIDGIVRLGSLGTDYWNRETEVSELYRGVGEPSSAADFLTLGELGVHSAPPLPQPSSEIKTFGHGLVVYEAGLPGGTGAGDTARPTSVQGYVEITSPNGIVSMVFTAGDAARTINLPAAWVGDRPYDPGSQGVFDVDLGTMAINRIVHNSDTGKYEAHFTYTLKSATPTHTQGGASDVDYHDLLSQGDAIAQTSMPKIGVVVRDHAGQSSSPAAIAIDVYDDGPRLQLSHATTGYLSSSGWIDDESVHLGNTNDTKGVLTPDYGPDGAYGASGDSLLVSFENPSATESGKPLWAHFDSGDKAAVKTGLGIIEFTKQSDGSIAYQYIAIKAHKGESEKITFTVMDGDKDIASKSMVVTVDQEMPADASRVDEAALTTLGPEGYAQLGSFHQGHGEASQTFSVFLPGNAVGFTWDIDAINANSSNSIKDDFNGTGVYTPVVWSVEAPGGNLIAKADGQPILTVTPPQSGDDGGLVLLKDAEGNWYSKLEVTLHYPIQHTAPASGTAPAYNVTDLSLGFKVAYTIGAQGETDTLSNAVSVGIIDDAPHARDIIAEVVETPMAPEDVYLIMDVSGSIQPLDLALGINALSALVQKYESEGIEAKFSLVLFAEGAKTWGTHLSAPEMLAILQEGQDNKTDREIATHWRSGVGSGTNYDAALDSAQRLIQMAQNDGTLRYYDQKVYFISDGGPNMGIDKNFGSWKAFIQQHGADAGNERVEVYALGVGSALSNATAWGKLTEVTADDSAHNIKVTSYTVLADKLVALVEQHSSDGNTLGVDRDLDDARSADLTRVVSVEVNDKPYSMLDSGVTESITLDEGVTLKVYANGDYAVSSRKSIDSDQTYSLKYTVKDSDGDLSTAVLKVVLKDAAPEAFDNVAGAPDANYRSGGTFILEDFSNANSGWLSANRQTVYGQKSMSDRYTRIDGTGSALSDEVAFVKITPELNTYPDPPPLDLTRHYPM